MRRQLQFLCAIIFILCVSPVAVNAQCGNDNTLTPGDLTPPGVGSSTSLSYNAGQYVLAYVQAGANYTATTCGSSSFDTQISVYDDASGSLLGYNDDFCGLQSSISFTPAKCGFVRVLLDQYFCNNSGLTATMTLTRNSAGTIPSASIAASGSTIFCQGGSVDLSASSSPVAAASYLWSTTETTGIITVGSTSTYIVTVTDGNNCTATASQAVTANPLPQVDLGGPYIQCGGSVVLDAGNVGSSYLWSDNSTGQTLTVNASSTSGDDYSVTVTDGNTCSASSTTHVTILRLPVVDLGGAHTQCGGSVTLDAGNSGSSFLWSDNSTGQTLTINSTSTSGNDYSVTVTDANTCSASGTAHVTIHALPVINLGGPYSQCSSVTLNAGNNGSLFLWSDNSTGQTLTINSTSTSGNDFSVTVTDANNCSASATTHVTVIPAPVVNLGGPYTQCGGSVTLDAGNAGSSYLWSDGSTNQTTVASTSGTYSVIITDPNSGCTTAASANVYIKPAPVVDLGNNVSQCGGSVTLDAGNPGDNYLWSDNSTGQTLVVASTNDYSVTVTDPNSGCTATDMVHITISPVPVVNLGPAVSQCGGSLTFDAGNQGAIYAWSNGPTSQTSTVSSSGTYSVTVLQNGCSASASVNVYINPVPVVNLGSDVTQCGGTVTLDAGSSGNLYLWSDNSTNQTLTISSTGNYSVTVTNSNGGCQATDNVNITINQGPTVDLGNDVVQCGGTVTLDAGNAGSTYLWSDNSTGETITVSTSGVYRVTVTNANNCSGLGTVNVTINPVPSLGPDKNDTICPGYTVDLNTYYPNNGYASYTWDTPFPTIAGAGVYTLTVSTAAGCTDAAVVSIDTFTKPNLGNNFADSICVGQLYNLTTHFPNLGFASYIWNTSNPYAVPAGSYTLTVTGYNGCTDVAVTNITNKIQPHLGADRVDSICTGYTVDLSAIYPPASYPVYNWVPNIPDPSQAGAGIYVLTVAYYQGGCTDDVMVSVITKAQPIVTLDPISNMCISEPAFALAGGLPVGGSYEIDGESQTSFDPAALGAGVHRVNYIYANISGCIDSASRSVEIYALPVPTTTALPEVCTGSPVINLNNFFAPAGGVFSGQGVSGNYFYPSIAAIGTNTITYVYTDVHGCSGTVSNTISVKQSVHVTLTSSDVDFTICQRDSIVFTAAGAEFYQFFVNDKPQGDPSTQNVFITYSLANRDEVYVVGSNSCSVDTSESIIIDVISLPTVSAGPDTTVTLGEPVILNTTSTGSSLLVYDWTPASYLNHPNIPNPTYIAIDTVTFVVTVTDIWGCKASDDITVNVFIPDNILLPNFLTPDGDGKNDQWILNEKIRLDGSKLVIFNRWGETVYEASSYPNNWDGTYKATGKKLPDDTYYYVLKVPLQNNHVYKGAINILNSTLK